MGNRLFRYVTDVGKHRVSTVLLGEDYLSYYLKKVPYETMVFRLKNGEVESWAELYCDRYATEDEAIKGHEYVVKMLQNGKKPSEIE